MLRLLLDFSVSLVQPSAFLQKGWSASKTKSFGFVAEEKDCSEQRCSLPVSSERLGCPQRQPDLWIRPC